MKLNKVLECKMQSNDANAKTVRDYLIALLLRLWEEREYFSGTLGNSGWENEIYASLIRGNLIDGELDKYGCVESIDEAAADKLITKAIKALH